VIELLVEVPQDVFDRTRNESRYEPANQPTMTVAYIDRGEGRLSPAFQGGAARES